MTQDAASDEGPGDLEDLGTGDAAKRIGNAPTTTDVDDPERSSRNTASGSGSDSGAGPVQTDPGDDATGTGPDDDHPVTSIQPHREGAV